MNKFRRSLQPNQFAVVSYEEIRILALDPSINEVGWAVVTLYRAPDGSFKQTQPDDWKWGHWEIDGFNLMTRMFDIVCNIANQPEIDGNFDKLVVEWPQFFDSARGHTAARQGYTLNLAGIAGYVAGWYKKEPNDVTLLTAAQWKGSVKKAVTQKRFLRLFNIEKVYSINHNAVDAIMLLIEHCKRESFVTLNVW